MDWIVASESIKRERDFRRKAVGTESVLRVITRVAPFISEVRTLAFREARYSYTSCEEAPRFSGQTQHEEESYK